MKLLLLSLLLFNVGIFCYGRNLDRIINGVLAPPDKYQNVVRFFSLLQFGPSKKTPKEIIMKSPPMTPIVLSSCTGSIISKRHILTAAHCVLNMQLDKKKIVLPALGFLVEHIPIIPKREEGDSISLSKYAIVADFEYHENFKWQDFQHDIAIIEFPNGTTLGEPVLLAKNYQEGENDIGDNVGFGDTNPDPKVAERPKALMQINLPIFAKTDCLPNDKDHPVICAGTPTHRSDHGDSGGPLFINGTDGKQYQVGIAHTLALKNGTTEGDAAEMVAFMRVSYYCDWIKEKTKGEAECVEIGTASGNGGMSMNIFVVLFAIIFALVF